MVSEREKHGKTPSKRTLLCRDLLGSRYILPLMTHDHLDISDLTYRFERHFVVQNRYKSRVFH